MSSERPGDSGRERAVKRAAANNADALPARLRIVVAEAIGPLGFDLDSLDVQQAGRRKVVKVVLDSDSGVGLDELAEATRLVSGALDDTGDVLDGPYTLEVTSPGVDRPLTRPRHWHRARFRLARVHTSDGTEFTCRVGAAGDEAVQLLVDGALRWVNYRQIARAVVEVEFRQPPATDLAMLEREASAAPSGDARGSEHGHGTKEESL